MGLLGEARDQVGELRGLTSPQLLPKSSLLLRPLQREESLRSSSLEGTFATPAELLAYELNPEEVGSGSDRVNQWREVYNYDRALQVGMQLVDARGFSNGVVRELHQLLLSGVRGDDKLPGQYRPGQVVIGADKRFVPPPGFLVQQCMDELVRYAEAPTDSMHGIVRSSLIHYQFEAVHPFRDGNGRIGRVLFSLMLAKWCGLSQPWLYLSSFFERHRDEYIGRLFRVSTHGEWEEWIRFCLLAISEQAQRTIVQCRKLLQLRLDWFDQTKRAELPARSMTLIESLFETPMIDWRIAKELTGKSRNTSKADLEKLRELGVIRELPGVRPQRYYAPLLMQIAHERTD